MNTRFTIQYNILELQIEAPVKFTLH